MMYEIKLHPKVVRFLDKCERQLHDRIRNKIFLLGDDPFRILEHFSGQDFYKLRIGNYRALVDVDISRKIIFVRHLEHRSKIYKNL